ncbi:MAG TPA: NAD(P)/FAD-dependent oxidoreductase [Ilumatobacteraceae bacterium]
MTEGTRNPHAGEPFTDDDSAIAAALEDVSIPALLCSLVHMTGDASWVRGELRPQGAMINEHQGYMSAEARAEVRRRAVPAIAAYRDSGCVPFIPDAALAHEMMSFLAAAPVDDGVVEMFLDDLHLDGADSGAITWRDELTVEQRTAAHTVVIGCGESGILAGIRLAQAGIPFTIVEKGAGPGGTWWDNRYPGARVDIGSHFYCYSFSPAHEWSEYYCQQPELRDYFQGVVDKYALGPHIRFRTEVTAATWDESTSQWALAIRTADGGEDTIQARFVISAVGALNLPKLPDIPGMDDFAGPSFHSARWPADLDVRGKRFAQIGAGASGFQLAPTIADEVEHLTVFQRTAQWMFPNPNYHRHVPAGDAWAMRHFPFYGRWFRFLMFYPASGLSIERNRIDPEWDDGGRSISASNAQTRQMFRAWIESQLADRPDLLEVCIPHYPPSAKRMLQDNGSWLTCLKKPNVELVREGIERIVPEGVITADGVLHEADIICYATGFRHNDFLAPIDFVGRGGASLHGQWNEEPTAYLGITVPNFPNLFCLYGPGTNLAHGASLIFQSECQINYVMSAIHEVLTHDAQAIEVRAAVHDRYAEHYQSEISQMVWAHWSVQHSHFKNADGRVWTLSPWPIPVYWEWTRAVDLDDYQLT